jgi:hypothetical protein
MADNRTNPDYDDADELLMNDDVDFIDDDVEEEQEETRSRARSFALAMRHQIEDRLENRNLEKKINEYELLGFGEDDTVH